MRRLLLCILAALVLSPAIFAIVDTNDNGVSDFWEKQFNNGELFNEAFDANADPDADGWTNAQEAAAGTNPFDPNPPDGLIRPEIEHIPAVVEVDEWGPYVVTPAAVTITWPTLADKQYTLLFSADLTADSWIPVGNPFVGSGSVVTYGFEINDDDKRFWRVAVSDIDTDGDGLTDAEERTIGSSIYLADTNGDGINDAEAYASGVDPSGDGSDADADGIPDNELYSVEIEVSEEGQVVSFDGAYKALTGTDDTFRYLVSTRTEEYSVSGSGRYGEVTDGKQSWTSSYLQGGILASSKPAEVESGTSLDAWQQANAVTPGNGETFSKSATTTTVSAPTTTATETFTTTVNSTPWEITKRNSNGDKVIVSSGTENITVVKRTKLTEPITYQTLWTEYTRKSPWEDRRSVPSVFGPLNWSSYNRSVSGDASAAEYVRDLFLNTDFEFGGTLSSPGSSYSDYGSDTRLKSLRWRWVRFDPLNPFELQAAAPPAGYRKALHVLLTQRNFLRENNGTSSAILLDETQTKGVVSIDCDASAGPGWHEVDSAKFAAFKLEEPTCHQDLDFSNYGYSQVSFGNLPIDIRKRIPNISNDGEPTTFTYQTVSSVPREAPLPAVEIFQKDIAANQITLSAKIYDALSDVTQSTPKVWVNSREQAPVAGDKAGVFRLQGHVYQLYPGRNEITIAVENGLSGRGSETIVVQGDSDQGYEIVGESVRIPRHPTYPLVLRVQPGFNGRSDDWSATLTLAGHTETLEQDADKDDIPSYWFRSKPFLSVLEPASATPAQMAALLVGKPVFPAELEDNLTINIGSSEWADLAESTVFQSGVELVSPKSVDVQQTGSLTPGLQFKARGLGASPSIKAVLTTYKDDEAEQEVTSALTTAYQAAYGALAADAKNDPVTFTVDGFQFKEGYNGLTYDFANSPVVRHGGSYQSFRFPTPTKAGVRVFSANRKKDTVLEGVSGRLDETWYPVDSDADLSELADALITSGCQIVGMTDLNNCFDDFPIKRSFLVRGPPGRAFQAYDQLYAAQGRTQRAQTFGAGGTHGAALAGELDRVQTDGDLPASARNALALEIASTYQFHNGFEDFVPKTHQAYVDPGTGTPQPNSWTMRGSSLPDDAQSNPSPWTVTNTLSDPIRAASASGIVKIDTTAENTAYYATTSATAPWDLAGARAVSLRFKLLEHDAANGPDGALQLAAGDGTRTWTCQVAPGQVKVQGTVISLPVAKFPDGLIDGKFHTLQFNLSGTGNDALVSLDGEVMTSTATAQTGTLSGIAFGDPGAGIAGKFETDSLGFENSELKYEYGNYDADDYADSDEIAGANNVLLYLRSKGQPFHTSSIARWVKILDPNVYEWLLEKYTGQDPYFGQQELTIYAGTDVWFGSIVDMEVTDSTSAGFLSCKYSKTSRCLNLDKEETKIFSSDQTRNEMQLAGILMAWCYEQQPYKVWLAEKEGGGTGIDGILIEKKHLVENIAKCAKRVETTLETGGEIAICMANEYADYAITIKNVSQGDYMAMVGFIPLVPSSTARVFKMLRKEDGAVIEAIHQLSTKLDDFPTGAITHVDSHGITRRLDLDKVFADAADSGAVSRARSFTGDTPISSFGPGAISGKEVLSTFAEGSCTIFKTQEPLKLYRVYQDGTGLPSNFLLFEKPQSLKQVIADQALINPTTNTPWQNYNRYAEVEIPVGEYVALGYAAKMTNAAPGGGTQIWIDDTTVGAIDWQAVAATATVLSP